jgi:hypothetical protein
MQACILPVGSGVEKPARPQIQLDVQFSGPPDPIADVFSAKLCRPQSGIRNKI